MAQDLCSAEDSERLGLAVSVFTSQVEASSRRNHTGCRMFRNSIAEFAEGTSFKKGEA